MNRLCIFLIITCVILLIVRPAAQAESFNAFTTYPSKKAGYTLGDIVEQRIQIERNGIVSSLEALPVLKREGLWLERIFAAMRDDNATLIVRYQVINAPLEPTVVSLPRLQLVLTDGQTAHTDTWSFGLSPQLPTQTLEQGEFVLMQTDQPATIPDTRSAVRNFRLLFMLLAAVLSAWLLWWLYQNRFDARHLPYARASRSLSKLDDNRLKNESHAWLALHKAFNETAGHTVSNGSLSAFMQQNPWLKPLESSITDFFNLSTQRFFKLGSTSKPFDLLTFSKRLRALEKSHYSGIGTTQQSNLLKVGNR